MRIIDDGSFDAKIHVEMTVQEAAQLAASIEDIDPHGYESQPLATNFLRALQSIAKGRFAEGGEINV